MQWLPHYLEIYSEIWHHYLFCHDCSKNRTAKNNNTSYSLTSDLNGIHMAYALWKVNEWLRNVVFLDHTLSQLPSRTWATPTPRLTNSNCNKYYYYSNSTPSSTSDIWPDVRSLSVSISNRWTSVSSGNRRGDVTIINWESGTLPTRLPSEV